MSFGRTHARSLNRTTISRVLMDYFQAQGMNARALDTQTSNGVLNWST
ncbi:hypothetical protein [Bradyrhizobium sp. Arg816]|nr:hypothetical protein [Bradyrhizobium sp. Arg816]MDI3567550.1 hypothetical protein [Bradyrhizobium sp. Arg816]